MKFNTFRFVLRLVLLPILFSTTQLKAADYYWVGGAGSWADLDHWATTSGGVITHPQIPTADDNVLFDANSFTAGNQVVNVTVATAFCRSMTWTGVTNAPILRGQATGNLVIYGSLTLSPNMQFDFRGDVTFQGAATGNTIAMASQKFFKNLTFDNVSGEWIFKESVMVDSTLTLKNGTLKTNSQAVNANRLYANCVTSGTLDLANSAVILRGGFYRAEYTEMYTFLLEPLHTKTVAGGSAIIDCTSGAAWAYIVEPTYRISALNPVNINILRFSNPNGNCTLKNYTLGVPTLNIVKFSANGRVLSNNMNIGTLSLTSGKTVEFESGKSFKIDVLEAVGTCVSAILIKSSNAGQTSNLTSSNPITADYITIQDITATGNFSATNAIKLGTTTGWAVAERAAQMLYWVNGNGNWDDKNHWSTTSGGASGACIPTAKDDVIFDAQSFYAAGQKAVINVEDAFCKTMSWNNTLAGAGMDGGETHNLHVFGSFYLAPTMDWQFNGKVLFESEELGKDVKMAGKEMLNDVIFNGDGGWILRGSLQTKLGIYFVKGTWNTNSEDVSCLFFRSETKLKRRWILQDSHIYVATVAPIYTGMIIMADSLTVEAGHSVLTMLRDFSTVYFFGSGNLKFYNLIFLNINETLSNERDEVKLSFNKVQFTSTHSFTRGSVTMDTLVVAAGSDNIYSEGFVYDQNGLSVRTHTKITVKAVIVPVGCDVAKTVFRKDNLRENVTFVANRDAVVLNSCIVKNILAEGNMVVNNGRGLGITTGWTINRGSGRQLYWVGNGGQWFDKSHWSLSSGGVGGECVPTDEDDVYFDNQSFTQTGQVVTLTKGVNGLYLDYVQACRNMDWTGVQLSPEFHYENLYVFGHLKFLPQPQMTTRTRFLTLLSDTPYTVQTEDQKLYSVDMAGKGIATLNSQIVADYLAVSAGGLTTNSHNITVSYTFNINNYTTDSLFIRLDNSFIRMTSNVPSTGNLYNDNVNFYGAYISFYAGTSTFQIESAAGGVNSNNPNPLLRTYRFYNLIFTNSTGFGRTFTVNTNFIFNKLFFAGNGELWNVNNIDSLIFSAGKTYSVSPTNLQTVHKYFELIGNNCESIRLQSLISGVKATILMNTGVVEADFVQMSDQKAEGSVTFFTGAHSTNIANTNIGWRFDHASTYKDIGFLGTDTIFCNTTVSIELKAFKSSIATYKWNTNATTRTIQVTTAGEYRAEVRFGNNCIIRDTIIIQQVTLPKFELADTTLCKNEQLTLTLPTVEGATYTWQDGTHTPQYPVTQTGIYKGEIALKGCKSSASASVNVIDVPLLNLGRDTTLCAGQTLNLNFNFSGSNYLWQDGKTTPQYVITQAGLYWLEVGSNRCKTRDSIRVAYINAGTFDIGPDKTLCEGETITLKVHLPNAQFRWQDGSTQDNFVVTQSGMYAVVASIGNCSAADSIKIDYKPAPIFELGNDTTLCEGNTIRLTANAQAGATYLWGNNSVNPSYIVNSTGKYKVVVTLNGCTKMDSVNINFNPIPILELGNDTTICESMIYLLKPKSNATTFKWQDGRTTPQYAITKAGKYMVEASLNGCSKMDTVQINFKPMPEFELGNDTTLCEGNTLMLSANAQTNATYLWENNMVNPYCIVNKKGMYKVIVTLNGCIKMDSVNVNFNPIPTLKLGNDTTICESTVLLLKPKSNAATFKWQDGSTQANFKVTQAGKYAVEANLNGCSKKDSVLINVTTLPKLDLGRDTVLCGVRSFTIKATSPNAKLLWFNNSTANSINVTKSNSYTAEANRLGCIVKDTIKVTFLTPPQYSLGADTVICHKSNFELTINMPNTNITWSDKSKQSSLSITKDGIYWADVATKEGCTFRDSIKVIVKNCTPFRPFVPNVFSPNNDGINDDVKPFFNSEFEITDNYSFQIYDRWGNMVFSTTDKNAAWDGTYRNQTVDNAVFVYMLRVTYRDFKGEENKAVISGDVTLLR